MFSRSQPYPNPGFVYIEIDLTQHTPKPYPRHSLSPRKIRKEFLHKLLLGGPGYVPGCWKINWNHISFRAFLRSHPQGPLEDTPGPSPTVSVSEFLSLQGLGKSGAHLPRGKIWAKSARATWDLWEALGRPLSIQGCKALAEFASQYEPSLVPESSHSAVTICASTKTHPKTDLFWGAEIWYVSNGGSRDRYTFFGTRFGSIFQGSCDALPGSCDAKKGVPGCLGYIGDKKKSQAMHQ